MAKGNEIVLSANPKGVYLEGIVSGTPKPGTVMQIKAATAAVGGRHTWEVFNADADGNQRLIAVLLPDNLQGKTATDAYVDGDRCFLYCPIAGEELNMLVAAAGTGTGDALAIGALLIVNDGDGILIATASTPESEPFIALEAVADLVAAGSLVHCMYTGH
ncbi:MAG: hypothetical protein WC485_00230 [Opitutaceae bacterium]